MKKSFTGTEAFYDVSGIKKAVRRNFTWLILKTVLCVVLLALSITAIVLYGGYLAVFIISLIILVISVILLIKQLKKACFSSYSDACGDIVDVHKDVKTVRGIAGGINPFGARMYDSYRKNEIRITLHISDKENIVSYQLNGVSEKHANYYEAKGASIHVWGTRFPVKTEFINGEWLCPICGEFNSNKNKECSACKNKITK